MGKELATFSFNEDDTFIVLEALHKMFKACMVASDKAKAQGFDYSRHVANSFTYARLTMEIDRVVNEKKWCNDPNCNFEANVRDFRIMFKTELAELAMKNNGNGK